MIRWNSKEIDLEPVEIVDVKATILDKDGVKHTKTFKGDYDISSDRTPYAYDTGYYARRSIENTEYVKTDKNLYIPRCNIKHITFKELKPKTVIPKYTLRGMKDWYEFEWVLAIVALLVGSFMTFVVGICFYAKYFQ